MTLQPYVIFAVVCFFPTGHLIKFKLDFFFSFYGVWMTGNILSFSLRCEMKAKVLLPHGQDFFPLKI